MRARALSMWRWRLATAVLGLTLAGCQTVMPDAGAPPSPAAASAMPAASTVPAVSAPASPAQDAATVAPARPASSAAWRHAGRLALTITWPGQGSDNLDKVERHQLGFEGEGDAQTGRLDLSTPLGTVVARLQWREGEALLQSSASGEPQRYPSIEALCEQLLGEPLPLSSVLQWLGGQPDPSLPVEWLQTAPGTQVFRQLGWTVRLDRWDQGLLQADREQGRHLQLKVKLTEPVR